MCCERSSLDDWQRLPSTAEFNRRAAQMNAVFLGRGRVAGHNGQITKATSQL